jgi:hypothetical protein
MEIIIFGVVFLVLIILIIPLTSAQLKETGTIRPPNKAAIIGGILVGAAVDYSPVGKLLWSTLLNSDLGLSPLSSRALAAGLVVGVLIVIALYIEAVVQRIRK